MFDLLQGTLHLSDTEPFSLFSDDSLGVNNGVNETLGINIQLKIMPEKKFKK
jgi:hypothetical protein